MAIEPDGVGKRKRMEIGGEYFYFTCTRGDDGWIHFTATVPYENRDENRKIRAAVDLTCKTLTAMINAELGNVGRPKEVEVAK